MIKGKKLLVFSAHAADYVWRSGGTIAKYIENGAEVSVVVMTFGVRGESNDIWKKGGQTYDSVEESRRKETEKAAEILGINNIEFWDLVDYPIDITRELEDNIVATIRRTRPDIIITHDKNDVLNPDHNNISQLVWQASVQATSTGVELDNLPSVKQMRIFGFEPHQTEISGFVPDQIVDITDVFDKKVEAMQCFEGQKHLISYYTDRGSMRGNHLRRISGNSTYKYAESFASFYPVAGDELV
ncbi:MAG: PIG-L family deacetylase [Tetragenococcus sp.]|nr:PIG-L family deacetylase [Tetragenococcus sp.]